MLKVGFFQFAPRFGEVEGNLSRVRKALHNCKADIIVLPELAFTGYLFQDRSELASLAEDPEDSTTVSGLTELCREGGFLLVAGFAEKKGDKIYNSALAVNGEGPLKVYRKIHLFSVEKEYFDKGDTPLGTIEYRGIKIGIMICFDWIFPEVTRILALKGADLVCHPSNLVLAYCQEAMLTRSIENSVFAITANRYGSDTRPRGDLTFTGQSQLVAPGGRLVHRAGPAEEELFIHEIDPEEARSKWITEKNHIFEDRRPEYYKELIQG